VVRADTSASRDPGGFAGCEGRWSLLTHELLSEQESEEYRNDWNLCFDKLEKHVDTPMAATKETR
jgi:hypothetical protein